MRNNQSLRKTFAGFVAPSIAAQWVFALYGMVDGMFVARGVGETALSAVNLSMPVVNFIFSLALVLAVGSSTILSIHLGRKEAEAANRVYTQNLLSAAILSVLLAVLILANLERVALFLGAGEGTLEYVKTYVGTVAAFCPGFVLSYYFEILIKADGKPRLAILMVTAGTVLNCILDYVFVFVIPWGVFGAALATGIAQVAVTLFFVVYFFSKNARLRVRRFRPSAGLLVRTFRLGASSGITEMSAGFMVFLFNHAILTHIGPEAIVSYTIAAYLNTILVMTMTGVAQGMQPLVSYHHGRGDSAVCRRLLRYGMLCGAALNGVFLLLGATGADWITGLFLPGDSTGLREATVSVIHLFLLSFPLASFNILVGGYFTAVESAYSSLAVSLSRGFVLLSFSVWLLATRFGGSGIWWAPALSEGLCALLTLALGWLYRKNRREASSREMCLRRI